VERAQRDIENRLKEVQEKEREVEQLRERELLELQRIASLTMEEAKGRSAQKGRGERKD
jgi:ribonuclease Y